MSTTSSQLDAGSGDISNRHGDRRLEADIEVNGILHPLTIYTDGAHGILADGYQRLSLAEKLGIKSLPVQIHPNNFRRMRTEAGFPPLEAKVKAWCEKHLLKHANHEITRHLVGSDGSAGIPANKWVKCECSCGAYWKEEG
jgi:hypothetical protein